MKSVLMDIVMSNIIMIGELSTSVDIAPEPSTGARVEGHVANQNSSIFIFVFSLTYFVDLLQL